MSVNKDVEMDSTAEKMEGSNAQGRRNTEIVYGSKIKQETPSSPPPKVEDLGVDASVKMEVDELLRDGRKRKIELLDISESEEDVIELIDLCQSDAEDEETPPVNPIPVLPPQEYFVIEEEDQKIRDIKIETLTQPSRPPTLSEVTEDQRQNILDKLNATRSRAAIKSSNFSTHRFLQSVHDEFHGVDSTVPPTATVPMPPNSPAISEGEFDFPTSSSGTLFTPIVRGQELLSAEDPSTSSVYIPLEEVQGKDLGRLHWMESQYAPVGRQEGNVYVVQDIRDVRFHKEKQYKVKWMGWSHEFNSWIKASELNITTGFPFLPNRQKTIQKKNQLKQKYF